MKIVLDTNVWISGLLLPQSTAGKILYLWQQNKYQLIISQPILDEIEKVLAYPKINKRLQWNTAKIEQYLSLLKFLAEFIPLTDTHAIKVERDLNDSPILTTLVMSCADYLVTGDNDLLSLKEFYPIITLADFYNLCSLTHSLEDETTL